MAGAAERVRAVARNTFREILRERVLYNLVFFAILMGLCSLLAKDLSIRQEGKIIEDFGLAAIELVGTLIALFQGVSLIGREVERRSIHVVLAKPLTRAEFLVGKVLGLGLALLVNVAAMTGIMYAGLWLAGVPLEPRLLYAVGLLCVGMLVVATLAATCSVVTTPTMATVWAFCLVVAGRYSDVIRNMGEVAETPTWVTRAVYYALPNFRNFDLKDRVVYGDPLALGDLLYLTSYGLVWVVLLLALAVAAFRSKDLP